MSLIGGIVGGMIGFTLLGPIGALVGSVMGSRMTRQAKSRRNPNNLDHQVCLLYTFLSNPKMLGIFLNNLSSFSCISPSAMANSNKSS